MSEVFSPSCVVGFFSCYPNATSLQKNSIRKGLFISTKCRRDLMLGEQKGKIIVGGTVYDFQFKNMGGGVWHVGLDFEGAKSI